MARSRAWETRNEDLADISAANDKTLQDAGSIYAHSSVEDLAHEVGGNRELAKQMLEYKGKEATPRAINSQMKSIQRWIAKEKGSTSQSASVSKPNRAIINKINIDQKTANKRTQVHVKGPSSVNGYKRGNRSVEVYLDPDESRELFNALYEGDTDAAWDILAEAYGVSEFHAYDDASIDFNL